MTKKSKNLKVREMRIKQWWAKQVIIQKNLNELRDRMKELAKLRVEQQQRKELPARVKKELELIGPAFDKISWLCASDEPSDPNDVE
jgi:hypothetical protein